MADTVRIEPVPAAPAGKKYMQVDKGLVYLAAGDEVTFQNALETPATDVKISFYPYDKAKTDANAIAGFCTGMGTNKVLAVGKGSTAGGTFTPGEADCEVASSIVGSTYQYSIDAQAAAWVDMDPVIIVEGGGRGGMPLLFGVTAAIIGAAIGALAMRYVTSRNRRSA